MANETSTEQSKADASGENRDGGEINTRYSMQHVHEHAEKAVSNISTLLSSKTTVYALTAIYKSKEEVLATLYVVEQKFKWLIFDKSSLDNSAKFFCEDNRGVNGLHLTGYFVVCDLQANGQYNLRLCVAEFKEKLTFDQIAYKIVGSSVSIVGGGVSCAAAGAVASLPFDAVTAGAAAVVFAAVGFVAGAIGAVFVNVDATSKAASVQKQLGKDLYDASTNIVNSNGIMEALLLHYVLEGQRYDITGKTLSIKTMDERQFEHAPEF